MGHLGTLDPLATGVLPLLLGNATRLAKFYERSDKVYEACVRFGFATNTYDAEGEASTPQTPVILERGTLERALQSLRGAIQQIPPRFSAKKIRGVPAYKLARQDKPVELAPIEVEIFSIDLIDVGVTEVTLRVHCSGGTYVRSLAHDLGVMLGCGAHLAELRRTRSGDFGIEQSRTLAELERMKEEGRLSEAVIPSAELLPQFPSVVTDELTTSRIRHGRDFQISPFRASGSRFVKALEESGALVAIGEAVLPNVYHPVVVLA